MNKTALLIGGLGLGAGLIYMLDPARGERRRTMAWAPLERYRRQSDDLWDHTTRSLGRQARELLARAPLARRYRRPGPGELLLARAEQTGDPEGHPDAWLYGARRWYDVCARSQIGQEASCSRTQ